MKKIRCPKCKNFIIFDETKHTTGQRLSFNCPTCNKQFSIKYGVSTNKDNLPQLSKDKSLGTQSSNLETPGGRI